MLVGLGVGFVVFFSFLFVCLFSFGFFFKFGLSSEAVFLSNFFSNDLLYYIPFLSTQTFHNINICSKIKNI